MSQINEKPLVFVVFPAVGDTRATRGRGQVGLLGALWLPQVLLGSFVYDWALLGVSLQGSGLAQALENRIQAGRGAAGSGIWTKPMVFERFSASAEAIRGRPLRSFEVRWDVLDVPGVALGSAAGRPWSTAGVLVSSWNHLGELGRVPWKPFGSACATLAMLQINEKPLIFVVFPGVGDTWATRGRGQVGLLGAL